MCAMSKQKLPDGYKLRHNALTCEWSWIKGAEQSFKHFSEDLIIRNAIKHSKLKGDDK